MDLSEIRELPTVVERLDARGPSGISAPHCWFCGKVGSVWFAVGGPNGNAACDCVKAQEARAGKRPKPRWNPVTNCIENLDAETIALNVALGYKVYAPPAPVTPIAVKSVTRPHSVTPAASDSVTPNDPVTPPLSPAAERMRRMRQRRAKQRGEGE